MAVPGVHDQDVEDATRPSRRPGSACASGSVGGHPDEDGIVAVPGSAAGEAAKGSRVVITVGRFEAENIDPDPGATSTPTPTPTP